MGLIQGGPPEWIWERTPDPLKWELVSSQTPEGSTVYELKVSCGLAIMRLQFFTENEINQLRTLIDDQLNERVGGKQLQGKLQQSSLPEPVQPQPVEQYFRQTTGA